MRAAIFLFSLAIAAGLSGCSHMIPPEARAGIETGLRFEMIRAQPEAHLGQKLLVGGNILTLSDEDESTILEIYSWQLDRRGEPTSHDPQGGRFLAASETLLPRDEYRPGLFVTLVGSVEGVEEREIDGVPLTLPLLRIEEIRLLDRPLRYDGPPRLNAKNPFPSPPWYEAANPYDPEIARPARDRLSPPY